MFSTKFGLPDPKKRELNTMVWVLTLAGVLFFSSYILAAKPVLTPADAFALTYPEIGRLPYEEVRALFLDRNGNLLKVAKITQYREAELYYVPWELVVPGRLPAGTAMIYVVHNHPGNTAALSEGDIEVGSYWANRAAAKGIYLDLLAITPDGHYVSLRESGALRPPGHADRGINGYLAYILEPGLAIVQERLRN